MPEHRRVFAAMCALAACLGAVFGYTYPDAVPQGAIGPLLIILLLSRHTRRPHA